MKKGMTSMRLAPGVYLRVLHYEPPYGEAAKAQEDALQQDVIEGKEGERRAA